MKVVITDHRFPGVDHERRAVETAGGQLFVIQTTDEATLLHLCTDADAILSARAPITRRVIQALDRCRIIVRYGIGVDTIDIAAATERGIMVANVPDYCVDEVSDHALTLLLTLSRQITHALALAKNDRWSTADMPALHRLKGQTCGLFGAGRIGLLLAKKLRTLGIHVIATDPYLSEDLAREASIETVPFYELLMRSDFISIHAPLTDRTAHIFNADSFSKMKATAYLINTARGGLIAESDLLNALDSGAIAGAALDVLESETAVTQVRSLLVRHPKILVTPHIAWLSEEARDSLQQRAIAQVLECLRGGKPYGVVNLV
jgi:D-3-phosphoglycerate dehydrogenase / 2-oxoglutarate reductase